jgi:hypothetical protein
VLKKILKLVTTFALLLGIYLGYVRSFAVVVSRLTAARKVDDLGFVLHDSRSKKEAILRAREAFGPGHWTAKDDLQLRYYNSERGFWMYSQRDQRIIEEDGVRYDGKRIKLRPAAIIWRAKDGSSTKTVTADEAIIDFNQSLSFNIKPDSEPIVVKFAKLEGNVMIRDDRGTPHDLTDDMEIGPLTWVKYDDSKLQIYSDSPVLIVDRDTRITGDGMLIQLRPKSVPVPGARSAGFEGAQNAQINQNVYVLFQDIGKTGFLPGSMQTKRTESGKVEVTAQIDREGKPVNGATKSQVAAEPVPLDLRCEGPMQIDFPRPHLPVRVGPPAPPGPTLVHFTRNVVARRGKLTELPDQLDADNLDLTLIPAEKTAKARSSQSSAATASGKPTAAASGEDQAADSPVSPESHPVEQNSILGDLTLRRVKATGHAVWLQQPLKGAKVRCNEMIHDVAQTGGQNVTYFRVDAIRKLWLLEKFDFVEDYPQGPEGPVRRQAQSVTYVWAQDATLFDTGGDMDHASLVARGPGRMETRPVPSEADAAPQDVPADRIATWQDQLVLKNEIGPDQKIEERVLILKGQPRIIDRLQNSSLDAVETVVAWLRPAPSGAAKTASENASNSSTQATANPVSGDGNFKIRRLLALRNVHLVAPSKNLTARNRLDADFEEAEKPTPAAGAASAPAQSAAATSPAPGAGSDVKTAENKAPAKEKPADPNMIALADRVEAKILIDSSAQASRDGKRTTKPTKRSAAANPADPDSTYEVRDVRMFGTVSFHQDPSPGKTKGQDAFGETLILRNEGPGKAIFNLYDRDPRQKESGAALASARPPAKVVTEDQTIKGEVIGVNQKTDEAWVYGPGELVQLTDRNLLSDKSPEDEAGGQNRASLDGSTRTKDAQTITPKPRSRAGKVQTERTPLVITWREKMLFHGRSLDPENRPTAKAEFFKKVRAEMEDGLLYCDDVMTTYTDQPVPLADLGKLSQSGAGAPGGSKTNQADDEDNAPAEKPKPDLTLIYLVGNAQAISRKVDPDRPVLLSRQRITGDRINYDRRTGDFLVPCAGMVYLHDRDNNSDLQPGSNPTSPVSNRRTIRPASGKPGDKPGQKKNKIPPLVLTQIKFTREMKGRFGTGKGADKTETRWAEFFGDIEAARAIVPNERIIINYDRPPPDTYFLTSQTMRVITVPPPPGAPENAPARNYLKAWENAYAKTSDTMIQADVITYDSQSDLIYANGQEGRLVQVVKQTAVGQPGSPTVADAVRVNPKTGAADVISPREFQLVDIKTGTRPAPLPPPDPNAKPPKPPKNPFRPPMNNVERRGFSGR